LNVGFRNTEFRRVFDFPKHLKIKTSMLIYRYREAFSEHQMRYTYYNIVSLILKGIRTNHRPDKFSVRTNLRPDKSQFVVLHGGKILRSCVP